MIIISNCHFWNSHLFMSAMSPLEIFKLNQSIDENLCKYLQLFLDTVPRAEAIFTLNACVELKKSLLHIVSAAGYEKSAALLIKIGVNINAIDCYGATPLHYASFGNHFEIARLLICNNAIVYENVHFYMKPALEYISTRGKCVYDILQDKIDNESFTHGIERYELSQTYSMYRNLYCMLARRLPVQSIPSDVVEDLATPYFCTTRNIIGSEMHKSCGMNDQERQLFTFLEIL